MGASVESTKVTRNSGSGIRGLALGAAFVLVSTSVSVVGITLMSCPSDFSIPRILSSVNLSSWMMAGSLPRLHAGTLFVHFPLLHGGLFYHKLSLPKPNHLLRQRAVSSPSPNDLTFEARLKLQKKHTSTLAWTIVPLLHRPPAVDENVCARNKARLFGAQVERKLSDLFHPPPSTQRDS